MRTKRIIKTILFLVILVLCWNMIAVTLRKPRNARYDSDSLYFIHRDPNYYDVLFAGTSISYTNISKEELYLQHGIAGTTIGVPLQTMYLSYFTLEEALKFQNPKVVMLDLQGMFYTEEDMKEKLDLSEYSRFYTSVEKMWSLPTKYATYKQAKELCDDLEFWDYFSNMYRWHSNWENLTKDNFVKGHYKDLLDGHMMIYNFKTGLSRKEPADAAENTGEVTQLPEINKEYFRKIAELCEQEGIELVLLHGANKLDWSWADYNALKQLADEYDLDLLDINLVEEEIGFDWAVDMGDGAHQNMLGAKKWTNYLGDYLKANFDLPDRRGDERYERYEENRERYEDAMQAMETKLELLQAMDFGQYLEVLSKIDKEKNVIFVVTGGEAAANLTDVRQEELLNYFGFQTRLRGTEGQNYLGIINKGILTEQLQPEQIVYSGELDNGVEYQVSSGDFATGTRPLVVIDGVEKNCGNGINFVVYNKPTGETISRVFFDTVNEENPYTTRMNENTVQRQTSLNVWKKVRK